MTNKVLFIVFSFFAFKQFSVAQIVVAESKQFKLERPSYDEAVKYRFRLVKTNASGLEIIKTFDESYGFLNSVSNSELVFVTKKVEGVDKYNLFDMSTADFTMNWEYLKIISLNDSIFVAAIKTVDYKSDWVLIDKKGKRLNDKIFPNDNPILDKNENLIFLEDSKLDAQFFGLNGELKYDFKGYTQPRIVQGNVVLKNKSGKTGVLNFEGKEVVPFEYSSINFMKDKKMVCFVQAVENGKCEVFDNINKSNLLFSKNTSYVELSAYMNANTRDYEDCLMLKNGSNVDYYTSDFKLILSYPCTVISEGEYGFWRILGKKNEVYILEFDFSSNDKITQIIATKDKVLKDKIGTELMFSRVFVDGVEDLNNSNLAILSGSTGKTIFLNKDGVEITGKLISDKDQYDYKLLQIDLGQGNQLVLTMENEINLISNTKDYSVFKMDKSISQMDEVFAFTHSEGNKMGISFYYSTLVPQVPLFCKTPGIFTKIVKAYLFSESFYIIGEVDGKNCIAYCEKDKFNYIFPDKMPDIKKLSRAENENPIEISVNKIPRRFNWKLETTNQNEIETKSKYDKFTPYSGELSYCHLKGKIGIGYLHEDGKFDELLPPQFDKIESVLGGDLWRVQAGKKVGIYYYDGRKSLDCIYDEIKLNGWDGGYVVKKDGKYGVMGYEGNVIYEIKYNSVEDIKKQNAEH